MTDTQENTLAESKIARRREKHYLTNLLKPKADGDVRLEFYDIRLFRSCKLKITIQIHTSKRGHTHYQLIRHSLGRDLNFGAMEVVFRSRYKIKLDGYDGKYNYHLKLEYDREKKQVYAKFYQHHWGNYYLHMH